MDNKKTTIEIDKLPDAVLKVAHDETVNELSGYSIAYRSNNAKIINELGGKTALNKEIANLDRFRGVLHGELKLREKTKKDSEKQWSPTNKGIADFCGVGDDFQEK